MIPLIQCQGFQLTESIISAIEDCYAMLGQKIEVISIKADLYKDGDGFRAHLDVAASAGCLDAVAHERDLITSIRIAKQQLLWQAESQHLGQ